MKEETKAEDNRRLEILLVKIKLLDDNTFTIRNKLDNFTSKVFDFSSKEHDFPEIGEQRSIVGQLLIHLQRIEEDVSEIDKSVNSLRAEIEWKESNEKDN